MDAVTRRMKTVDLIGNMPEIETTELGLRVLDPDMNIERAEEIYKKLKRVCSSLYDAERCVQFSTADLMNHIEENFGHEAYQCFDEMDWQRTRNWRWVARTIPIDERRIEQCVSFDHYRHVAPLSVKDRDYYLSLVVRQKLSTRDLQKQIDYDMGLRVLEGCHIDEKAFWKEYWDETKCHYTKLSEAIKRGVEAVKEELEAARKIGFEEWREKYVNDPDNDDKMTEMQFLDCWIAAQQNA